MRKILAISILILFAARPSYCVGYYIYFELNLDYIVKTYCVNKDNPQLQCNGKCHLSKKLGLENEKSGDKSTTALNLSSAFFPLYFQPISETEFAYKKIYKNLLFYYLNKAEIDFQHRLDRPPQYFR